MTVRGVVLGLVGAALVCGVTYFNDQVLHQTMLVGNSLPIAVFGPLILFLVLGNPLLRRLRAGWALTGPELAVILTLTLAACSFPGSGLMRTFTPTLLLPFQVARTTPAWRDLQVIEQVPAYMLPHVTAENENEVLNSFVQGGLGTPDRHITLAQIPWGAWTPPLLFWLPLILLLWVGLLGLALVVHRQWADHEQLPYPIAGFAHALLPTAKGALSEVLRNKLFWGACAAMLLLHLNNYACKWYPDLIPVPVTLDFTSLKTQLPLLAHTMKPTIFFSAVAFSYFIAADVALGLGLGYPLWGLLTALLVTVGYTTGSGIGNDPTLNQFAAFGAYTGFLLVLLYTGRRFYVDVFRRAVGLRAAGVAPLDSVWGARVFLLAMGLFTAYLSLLGRLDWQLALLFTLLVAMMFMVMSRIIAETGVFFIQSNIYPTAILLGLMGAGAIGPPAILLLGLFTTVLLIDPREAFMPMIINALKVLDVNQVRVGKAAGATVLALVVGLAVVVPATLYFQYDRGANMLDTWATKNAPTMAFDSTVKQINLLKSQDQLAQAQTISGWGHFAHWAPNPKMLVAFGITLALVLLFTVGRLRFTRWPIHPVMFLLWNTFPGSQFAFSFLLGWAIKALVTKYGGNVTYRQLKPLFFGIIAGEMVAGVVTLLIGLGYFLVTGELPKAFSFLPG